MRTMASVWFLMIVLVAVQEAFGNECNKKTFEKSCNECIRCGGNWCNSQESTHCEFPGDDDWCPNDKESLYRLQQLSKPGNGINPIYAERTLNIDVTDTIKIDFTMKKEHKFQTIESIKGQIEIVNSTQIKILNSTQTSNITFEELTKCSSNNKCATTIQTRVPIDFCSSTSTTEEFVYVQVNVGGLDDAVLLKYHVPCACMCSKIVEKNSAACSGHGDLSCGICTCHDQWSGYSCDKSTIEPTSTTRTSHIEPSHFSRGDLRCMSYYSDRDCFGNGYCDSDNNCKCYDDREGSQYFDEKTLCMDICTSVNFCEYCLTNSTTNMRCDACESEGDYVYMQRYTPNWQDEIDNKGRKVWVQCNRTVDDCYIEYATKKDDEGDIIVMVIESCNNATAAGRTDSPQVPIILGVVGILVTLAAIGGIMVWKHMNALPPAPLNNPGYENIDAEDCTGENPLYKPPTSSFKNPMYGNKW